MDYYAVLCDEAGNMSLHKFAEPRLLASHLKRLAPTTRGFVLYGNQLHVTAGPWRFLTGEGIEPIPLFDPPVPGKKDSSSRLGVACDEADPVDVGYASLLKEAIEEDAKKTEIVIDDEDEDDLDDEDEDLED